MNTQSLALSILICGLTLLIEPVNGIVPPIPQQNAAKKLNAPTDLTMEIRGVNGAMSAIFTNHTHNCLGVTLGKKFLRLKPGKSGTLAVPKAETLKVYSFFQEGKEKKWRPRISKTVIPQAGRTQFTLPK